MSKTETTTGLSVKVCVLEEMYATGGKCTADFKKLMRIVLDKLPPGGTTGPFPNPCEIGK